MVLGRVLAVLERAAQVLEASQGVGEGRVGKLFWSQLLKLGMPSCSSHWMKTEINFMQLASNIFTIATIANMILSLVWPSTTPTQKL